MGPAVTHMLSPTHVSNPIEFPGTARTPSLWCPSLWDQGLNDEKFPPKHLCSQQIIVLALEPSLCVVVSLLLRQNPCTAPKTKTFFPQKRQGQNSCGAGRLGTSHRLSPGDVEQERSSVPGGTAHGALALLDFGARAQLLCARSPMRCVGDRRAVGLPLLLWLQCWQSQWWAVR